MDISVMEQLKKRARDSRDKIYAKIAKVMATVPGVVKEKAYR